MGRVDFKLLQRWWPLPVGSAMIACLLAAAYIAVVHPVYQAEVRVVIQNRGLGVDRADDRPTYDKEFLSTQAEIIRSPATISRSLKSLPHPPDERVTLADPGAKIADQLQVNLLASTDIVRITFQDIRPDYAAARLKSIIESYRDHVRSAEQMTSSETIDLLGTRETEVAAQLRSLQERLVTARANAAEAIAGETAEESSLLKELTNRWVAVEAELASTEAHLNVDHRDLLQSANVLLSSAARELVELEDKVLEARLVAVQTARVYGPIHPDRVFAEERVTALTSQLKTRQQQLRSDLELRREALAQESQSLRRLLKQESDRLNSANVALLDQERLQAEITNLERMHASTVDALESVRLADRTLAKGRTSIFVDVLDEFTVPVEPLWPRPFPLLVGASVLGMLLGLAGAVALAGSRPQEDDLVSNIPVLEEVSPSGGKSEWLSRPAAGHDATSWLSRNGGHQGVAAEGAAL